MASDKLLRIIRNRNALREPILALETHPEKLSKDDKALILRLAIALINYSGPNALPKNDFGYHLLLVFCRAFSETGPLLDYGINSGLYPLAREMMAPDNQNGVQANIILARTEEKYVMNGYLATREQYDMMHALLESESKFGSIIAPTSYGKSEYILSNLDMSLHDKNHGIIVPTKSLLAQTYKAVRSRGFPRKIITHDEMYSGDEDVIAILTQERAMRLLTNNPSFSFSNLYIDEAHKLLARDGRALILFRLLSLNETRNPNNKVLFLSPLIEDSKNLRISSEQTIEEHRVDRNLKSTDFYYLDENGNEFKYLSFLDLLEPTEKQFDNIEDYIISRGKRKAFLFLGKPSNIELFAQDISSALPVLADRSIEQVVEILKNYFHEDHMLLDCIKRGCVFIHGQIPASIKDYLMQKFVELPNLKYLIANHVVMEGINLPIDAIFFVDFTQTQSKDLINAIGRVNRLNIIFNDSFDLTRLLPAAHFLWDDRYRGRNNPLKRLEKLSVYRNQIIDEVKNPLLPAYPENDYEPEEVRQILDDESVFKSAPNTDHLQLRKDMITLGLNSTFRLTESFCETFWNSLQKRQIADETNKDHIIEIVSSILNELPDESFADEAFRRLKNNKAVSYYVSFVDNLHSQPFKERLNHLIRYLMQQRKSSSLFYVGHSIGDTTAPNGTSKVYVDLLNKNRKEIVSIAVRKIVLEEGFLENPISPFVTLLHQYRVIANKDYLIFRYGTTDDNIIRLLQLGLPHFLTKKLQEDNHVERIETDQYGNLYLNKELSAYSKSLDDFMQYSLLKIFGQEQQYGELD